MPTYGPQGPQPRLSWPPPVIYGPEYYTEEELQQLLEEVHLPLEMHRYLFFDDPAATIYEKLLNNWKISYGSSSEVRAYDMKYMLIFWTLCCVHEEDLLTLVNTACPVLDVVKWRYRIGK